MGAAGNGGSDMISASQRNKLALRYRREVVDLLRSRGPMSSSAIAAELGYTRSKVYETLKELQRRDLASPEGENNATRWGASPIPPDLDTHQTEFLGVSSIFQAGYLFHKGAQGVRS
jgi:hypothetical protein